MAETEFVITHDDLEQIVPDQEQAFLHHHSSMDMDYGPLPPRPAQQVTPEDGWHDDSPQQVSPRSFTTAFSLNAIGIFLQLLKFVNILCVLPF